METLNEVQMEFFRLLSQKQKELCVCSLLNMNQQQNMEELLYDVTYEMACCIMELLDGYVKDDLKFKIIEENRNVSLRQGIELHDVCAEYLKHT